MGNLNGNRSLTKLGLDIVLSTQLKQREELFQLHGFLIYFFVLVDRFFANQRPLTKLMMTLVINYLSYIK